MIGYSCTDSTDATSTDVSTSADVPEGTGRPPGNDNGDDDDDDGGGNAGDAGDAVTQGVWAHRRGLLISELTRQT